MKIKYKTHEYKNYDMDLAKREIPTAYIHYLETEHLLSGFFFRRAMRIIPILP